MPYYSHPGPHAHRPQIGHPCTKTDAYTQLIKQDPPWQGGRGMGEGYQRRQRKHTRSLEDNINKSCHCHQTREKTEFMVLGGLQTTPIIKEKPYLLPAALHKGTKLILKWSTFHFLSSFTSLIASYNCIFVYMSTFCLSHPHNRL